MADPYFVDDLPSQYFDKDPEETAEWKASLDAIIDNNGPWRARQLMLELIRHSRERSVGLPSVRVTDYINTIPPEKEPIFPGDEEIEHQIRRYLRWNAAMIVHRAQRPGVGVGGHISSYASSASLYEVGFNHFFRGLDQPGGGDQIFFQGHAAPGMYSRAFVEGRFTEHQLDGFRQEVSHAGGGLPSYPHPRLLPDFWQFPTVSMGLGPHHAIYQARFNRYLHGRGIKDTSDQQVWAFLGDGETDEPESLGAISLAAREGLDNLIFVVNCNLQRLDGPVRGNGQIIQELEAVFRGVGWNVIKVLWGSDWDPLLAQDKDGLLARRMGEVVDGEYQKYTVAGGAYIREHFWGVDDRLKRMVADKTDDELWAMRLGGHDPLKVYAAYHAATQHRGAPTVILARTIKGYGLGEAGEGRNITHQQKHLNESELMSFRDRFQIPLSDEEVIGAPLYRPAPDSAEMRYMLDRRRALGGPLPERRVRNTPITVPDDALFKEFYAGSGDREASTTMVFVNHSRITRPAAPGRRRFGPDMTQVRKSRHSSACCRVVIRLRNIAARCVTRSGISASVAWRMA